MIDPVARIDVVPTRLGLLNDGKVGVAGEYEIDFGTVGELLFGPRRQRGGANGVGSSGVSLLALGLGDKRSQAAPPIRMQYPKRSDADRTADDLLQDPIADIATSDAVPMHHEGAPAGQRHLGCVVEEIDADLVPKERTTPRIVIAAHEIDRDTTLAKVFQRRQNPIVLRLDHGPVFEPEIEEVAVDQKTGTGLSDVREKAAKGTLRLGRDGAKMNIGNDVDGKMIHCGANLPATWRTDNGQRVRDAAASTPGLHALAIGLPAAKSIIPIVPAGVSRHGPPSTMRFG